MAVGRKPHTGKKGAKKKTATIATGAIPLASMELARLCANVAVAHKAEEPVILQVTEVASFTDYFVILSGRSTRHVQAVAEHIEKALHERHLRLMGVEGLAEGQWVLLDAGDVVVHIFYHPVRGFYDLEGLWAEAPQLDLAAARKKRRKPTHPDFEP